MSVVCIAGMHRSGTSAVANMLARCGLTLGPETDLMPPDEFNPDGYWEHRELSALNDDILAALDAGWDDPPRASAPWQEIPDLELLLGRAAAIVAQFGEVNWGWKDPRNCLTLPFWRHVLGDLRVVCVVRNPVEVAMSLRRRNFFSSAHSFRLWQEYNERLLEATDPGQRIVVAYGTLLTDPVSELRRMASFAGLSPDEQKLAEVAPKASPVMRNARVEDSEIPPSAIPSAVVELFARLMAEAGSAAPPPPEAAPAPAAGRPGPPDSAQAGWILRTGLVMSELSESVRDNGRSLHRLTREVQTIDQRIEDRLDERLVPVTRALERLDARLRPITLAIEKLQRDTTTKRALESLEGSMTEAIAAATEDLALELARVREELAAAPPPAKPEEPEEPQEPEELDYATLVREVRLAIEAQTPPGSVVAVVSRGDESLAVLPDRHGWHFPRTADGVYAGQYPADGITAVAEVQALTREGAEYLVFPDTARWWLAHYGELHGYLLEVGQLVADTEACLIFALGDPEPALEAPPSDPESGYPAVVRHCRSLLSAVLPAGATVAVVSRGDDALVELDGLVGWHFPRAENGAYAGFHPSDSAAAVAHLERLRDQGASYLAIPEPAFWWLTHYDAFCTYLATRYRRVLYQRRACILFDLEAPTGPPSHGRGS